MIQGEVDRYSGWTTKIDGEICLSAIQVISRYLGFITEPCASFCMGLDP